MENKAGIQQEMTEGSIIGILPESGEIVQGIHGDVSVEITRGNFIRNEEITDAVTVRVEGVPRERWSALGQCSLKYGFAISTIVHPSEPDSKDEMVFAVANIS